MTLPFALRRAVLAAVVLHAAGALGQGTAARPAPAASAPAASQESCTQRRIAYARSGACYARFRTVHGVKAEAEARCGPPLKEPVDCPRP